MAGLELATAYVTLTVSGSGIRDGIRDQIRRARPDIDRAGRDLSDSIESGAQRGAREGSAAMKQLQRAIREAASKVEIGADTAEARAALERIRRELRDMPSGHALVEIDSSTANTAIERINAQLSHLSGESVDISVHADVAEAMAQVRAIGEQVESGARQGEQSMDRLRRAIERASGNVEIHANASDAEAAVDRVMELLHSLPDGRATVEVNTAAADAALAAINAELSQVNGQEVDISADADVAAALASLAGLDVEVGHLDGNEIDIPVDVDTGEAMASLAALSVALDRVGGKISVVKLAAASLAPALIPIAAAGVPAIAGLGTAAVGAAAGMGTLVMAIKPVMAALEAKNAADDASAQAAGKSAQAEQARAKAITSATEQVASAQRGLANTRAQVASAAENAAERVRTAQANVGKASEQAAESVRTASERIKSSQQSLANTQASVASAAVNAAERVKSAQASLATARESAATQAVAAAQRVVKAQESVRDAETTGAQQIASAQRALSDAREQAARRVSDALTQVGTAERSLASAQRSSLSAQQALNDARESARRSLEDMNTQLRSSALQERAGVLQVQEARERLAKTMSDPKASQLEREQAQLSVDQAIEGLDETRARRARLAADTAAANKAGVDGAKAVVSAQQAVTDATQRTADAAAGVQKARASVADAQREAARSVADAESKAAQTRVDVAKRVAAAQETVAAAVQAQSQQARQGAQQIAAAENGVTSAMRAQADQARQGAQQIAAAQQSVRSAVEARHKAEVQGEQQVAAARAAVGSALRAQVDQQRQGAQQIVSAQESVRSAQRSLQEAYAQTGTSANAAATKAADAMAKLSPAGRDFVNFLHDDFLPSFEGLGRTAQEGMLPGFQQALGNLKPLFGPLSQMVGDVSKRLGDMAVAASKALTGPFWTQFFTFISKNAGPWMETFGRIIGNVATGLAGLFMASAPAGEQFTGMIERLSQRFADFGKSGGGEKFKSFLAYAQDSLPRVAAFIGNLVGALTQVVVALAPVGTVILGALTGVLGFIKGLDPTVIRVAAIAIVSLLGAFKLLSMAVNAALVVQEAHLLVTGSNTAATIASRIAQLASAAASRTMAAAQWLVNAAMNANPIGLVVVAITALVAGLVLAYQKSETFRDIVNAAFGMVKSAILGTLSWITGTFWPGFMNVLNQVGGVVVSAKDTVVTAWGALTGAFSTAYNWVVGFFKNNWQTILGVITGPVGLAVLAVTKNWDSIKAGFSTAYNWVIGFFKNNWQTILGVITGPVGLAVLAIVKNWDSIKAGFTAAKDWVLGAFKTAWNGVQKILTDPVGAAKAALDTLLGATGLRKPFTAVSDWIKSTFKRAWDGLKLIFTDPVQAAKNVIETLLGATGLRKPMNEVWGWVSGFFKREWNGLKKIFTDPVDAAKTVINNILGADSSHGLRGSFSSAVRAIGTIWDGLKKAFKDPINAVIDIVNNGFIGPFNGVADKVGLKSFHIDKLRRYASGGTVPGRYINDYADNTLAVTDAGVPIARVNPGEYITRNASVRSMERSHPGTLDYINRYGDLPGYARGGWLGTITHAATHPLDTVKSAAKTAKDVVAGTLSGNAMTIARIVKFAMQQVGKPYVWGAAGPGSFDCSGLTSTAYRSGGGPSIPHLADAQSRLGRAVSRNNIQPGDLLFPRAGHPVPHVAMAVTKNAMVHASSPKVGVVGPVPIPALPNGARRLLGDVNAIEVGGIVKGLGAIDMVKGGVAQAAGAMARGLLEPLRTALDAPINAVMGRFGKSFPVQMAGGGGAKKIVNGAIDWAEHQADTLGGWADSGSPTGASPSGGVERWSETISQALQLNGITPTDDLMRRWKIQMGWESSGNPNAVQGDIGDINNKTGDLAKGLVQVIGSTFRAYHVPGTANNVFDPLANLAAGINYARHQYGPNMGYIGSGSRHGYASGGLVKAARHAPVFDSGGTLAPGLNVVDNRLGKPEALVRPEHVSAGLSDRDIDRLAQALMVGARAGTAAGMSGLSRGLGIQGASL